MATTQGTELRKTLKGVTDSRYSGKVTHYRGIQYATISGRFAKPVLNTDWSEKNTDCRIYGPRCPQPQRDVRDLMRIPKTLPQNDYDTEDELRCANLNLTCPSECGTGKLPVLLWIYGGSQMNSFGSAAQKLGDPGPLVAQSIELGKPIILVTIHYRLNIFGFGDQEGELNLGLQDQRVSIEWIKRYVKDFGGDPENITVGGESAGAIYTHALLATGSNADIARVILVSASLYATPPRPEKDCFGIIGLIEGNLQLMEMEKGNMEPANAAGATLAGAPADVLVHTLKDLGITSLWMWSEAGLQNWDNDGRVFKNTSVMIGDVEFESVLWEAGIQKASVAHIQKCFETTPLKTGKKLAEMYGINTADAQACRSAALDFMNDECFAYPAQRIAKNVNKAGGNAYQYHFDQVNPFAKPDDARSHHAVDLFAIFGGYDGFLNEDMKQVGVVLRNNWIEFINGAEPWNKEKIFTYGPEARTAELTRDEAIPRRRQKHFEVLEEIGHVKCNEVFQRLKAVIANANTSSD